MNKITQTVKVIYSPLFTNIEIPVELNDLSKIEGCVKIRRGYEDKPFDTDSRKKIISVYDPFNFPDRGGHVDNWMLTNDLEEAYHFGSIGIYSLAFDLYKSKIRIHSLDQIAVHHDCNTIDGVPTYTVTHTFNLLDNEFDPTICTGCYFGVKLDITMYRTIETNQDFKEAIIYALKKLCMLFKESSVKNALNFVPQHTFNHDIEDTQDPDLPF